MNADNENVRRERVTILLRPAGCGATGQGNLSIVHHSRRPLSSTEMKSNRSLK